MGQGLQRCERREGEGGGWMVGLGEEVGGGNGAEEGILSLIIGLGQK